LKLLNFEPGRGKRKNSNQIKSTNPQVTQLEELLVKKGKGANEKKEEDINSIDRSSIVDEVEQVPDQYKQRQINMAFSAKITKKNLLLFSDYDNPPIEYMRVFLSHICVKKLHNELFDEDLYIFIFLFGLITGMNFKEVIQLLQNMKTKQHSIDVSKNRLRVFLNEKLFGGIYNGLSTPGTKYITFELPKTMVYFFKNIHRKVSRLNTEMLSELYGLEQEYTRYLRNKRLSCPITISFDEKNLWRLLLTYQANDKNMSSFFAIGKYTTQIRSTTAYGTTHKSGQIHSTFIRDIFQKLKMEEYIGKLVDIPVNHLSESILFDTKAEFCGSNRWIDRSDVKKFFSLMRRAILIEVDNEIKYYNLNAIYTRYALAVLLATRHLRYSCKVDNVSFELGLMTVVEKSETKAGGTRLIPLSKKAKEIIGKYKQLSREMNIPSCNVYLIVNGKKKIFHNTNRNYAVELLKEYEVDPFIINFVENVWLNFGRHILVEVATERGFDFSYLQTLLGHFTKGCEQHGIVSVLDEQNWHQESIALFDHIGKLYGV